jgi:hypothetical protein
MSDETDKILDQAEEDILSYTVSDEALEAAAGHGEGGVSSAQVILLPTLPSPISLFAADLPPLTGGPSRQA